jgi:hypothetical protein
MTFRKSLLSGNLQEKENLEGLVVDGMKIEKKRDVNIV